MRILYGSNPYQISLDVRSNLAITNLSYKHILMIYASFIYNFTLEGEALKIIKLLNNKSIKLSGRGLVMNNSLIQFSNTYYKRDKIDLKFRDNSNKPRSVEIYSLDKSKVDTRKSNNACCPNYFHSLDSYICLGTLGSFQNLDKFIVPVHDSFTINKCDEELLYKSYNELLYSCKDNFVNLIDSSIDSSIDLNAKHSVKVNSYRNSLMGRNTSFAGYKQSILGSKATLKREFSTKIVNPTDVLLSYVLDLPTNTSSDDFVKRMISNTNLNHNLSNVSLQIYSKYLPYLGGYRRSVSSRVYKLADGYTCLQEFYSKLENYGEDDIQAIKLDYKLKFTGLNVLQLQTIKDIHSKLIGFLKDKPLNLDSDV